jgi:hypothetical protein
MVIRFTHGYDLLSKIGAMVGGIMLVSAGADLLSPISNLLEHGLKRNNLEWIWIILMWAYIIGGYIGAIMLLGKTILPYWLPTYLHVRFSLFTKITPDEAERLGFLFDGSLGGGWYPLALIRKIDREFRREALFRFANKIAAEHGWRRPFAMPEDNINKQRQQSQQRANTSDQTTQNGRSQPTADAQISVCLEILGLNQMPASFEAIKLAYRRKIKEFHPDKFAGERPEVIQYAEEISKRLNVAYEFLEQYFARSTA